ncbi:hypothetical protein FN846DRAFT_889787 [Sphaerosporella brunnea]|uniref:Uncharacterized protein n=1 Tax=Sphaerosporella brunnea TaxID=1250544 RepID=A0A5J5EYV0_9PEZI|nr:hypothetical protein FN846DRAFT_889787 [Sphaerosporella brunnea]
MYIGTSIKGKSITLADGQIAQRQQSLGMNSVGPPERASTSIKCHALHGFEWEGKNSQSGDMPYGVQDWQKTGLSGFRHGVNPFERNGLFQLRPVWTTHLGPRSRCLPALDATQHKGARGARQTPELSTMFKEHKDPKTGFSLISILICQGFDHLVRSEIATLSASTRYSDLEGVARHLPNAQGASPGLTHIVVRHLPHGPTCLLAALLEYTVFPSTWLQQKKICRQRLETAMPSFLKLAIDVPLSSKTPSLKKK